LDAWAKEEETNDDIDPEEGGWELDANGDAHSEAAGDDNVEVIEDEELGAGAVLQESAK
jgi:coatomer protein complex subunit alpha (xenin)